METMESRYCGKFWIFSSVFPKFTFSLQLPDVEILHCALLYVLYIRAANEHSQRFHNQVEGPYSYQASSWLKINAYLHFHI